MVLSTGYEEHVLVAREPRKAPKSTRQRARIFNLGRPLGCLIIFVMVG